MATTDARFNRVLVFCRICPVTHGAARGGSAAAAVDGEEGEAPCVSADAEGGTLMLRRGEAAPERVYSFDGVLPPSVSQAEVFSRTSSALLSDVLMGFNGTLLVYGQTGTGKTHTLAGRELGGLLDGEGGGVRVDAAAAGAESAGILPRALLNLFAAGAGDAPGCVTCLSLAAVQLYCETVTDLLVPGEGAPPLSIRESPTTGVYVEGATWVPVASPDAALAVVSAAAGNRATAATLMNATSSRSHAVFMVRVERTRPGAGGPSSPPLRSSSSLFLVDLAGSERVGRSGVSGERLDEARAINLSLSALGNCIAALAGVRGRGRAGRAGAGGQAHVPYRDSKLTRLLQDSLGGNARTVLIVTVSPEAASFSETSGTLEFGARASRVAVHATRNEEVDYRALYAALLAGGGGGNVEREEGEATRLRATVAALEAEAADLRAALAEAAARGGVVGQPAEGGGAAAVSLLPPPLDPVPPFSSSAVALAVDRGARLAEAQAQVLALLSQLRATAARAGEAEKEARAAKGRLAEALDEATRAAGEAEGATARAVEAEAEAERLREQLRVRAVGGAGAAEVAALYEGSLRALQARVEGLERRAGEEAALTESLAYALLRDEVAEEAAAGLAEAARGEAEAEAEEEEAALAWLRPPPPAAPAPRPPASPAVGRARGGLTPGSAATAAQLARANAAALGLPTGPLSGTGRVAGSRPR